MIEVSQMRRTYSHEVVKTGLVRLKILQAGTSYYPSQRMTHKVNLEFFQVRRRIHKIFNFYGEPMGWLLNLLFRPSFIDCRQQHCAMRVLIFQVIAQGLHIKRRSLISMNKNYNLSLKTGLSVDHEVEIVLSGLKESLVVLESIDEKRTFFGLNNGLAGLF